MEGGFIGRMYGGTKKCSGALMCLNLISIEAKVCFCVFF